METVLTPANMEALEQNAMDSHGRLILRDILLIRFIYHTGCRVSEAIGLTVDDLDPKTGTVRILRQKERLRLSCPACGTGMARRHHYCPGCGQRIEAPLRRILESRRHRILDLDPKTLRALKEFIERGGPVSRDGRRFIFGISRFRAWQIVTAAAARAGLGPLVNADTSRSHNVSPHRLRDAFATHAVSIDSSTEGLRLLQDQLGHASFNTTAKYIKTTGKKRRSWLKRLWISNG